MLAVEGEQCLDRNSEIIRALLAASLAIEKKKGLCRRAGTITQQFGVE